MIRRLPGNEDLDLPQYQSAEAVAMDLHAAVMEPTRLAPGDIILVPCGFSVAIPVGEEDGDEAKFWQNLSTGVPKVGVVTKLWRDGPDLIADLSDLLPIAKELALRLPPDHRL